MKSRLLLALLFVLSGAAAQWQRALPGYHYEFPKDHFSHPDYQTEWWYYTGNLHTPEGRRFGFELTFFRQAVDLPKQQPGTWNPGQIYLAHLALSDIDGKEFYHTERLNRAGPGLAGITLQDPRYWNGNWQVKWTSLAEGSQQLQAVCDRFTLQLDLTPQKPFVIHGKNGVSQKAAEPGKASHYISFTRLGARGQLDWKGASVNVEGLAWMDHEFFTGGLDEKVAGWDWFAIQLQNNEEIMLYRLRQKSGKDDPYSSGTYIDSRGQSHFLDGNDFTLSASEEWQSPRSGARYPLAWQIRIPSLDLDLSATTLLQNQELFSKSSISPTYWEGAMLYQGRIGSQPTRGVGYLEMTGYDKALQLGQK